MHARAHAHSPACHQDGGAAPPSSSGAFPACEVRGRRRHVQGPPAQPDQEPCVTRARARARARACLHARACQERACVLTHTHRRHK
eukprot:5191901-Pleurochrysis_carterae.AAC.1